MEEHGAEIRDRLEKLYREIEVSRMDGVPILNTALSVNAFGFEPFQDYSLGVLLTPWFMNLVLVPRDQALFAKTAPKVGEKVNITLPAGRVEFIVGYEDEFGHSLSCSLFSPVFEFEDQAAATETAIAALAEVLSAADDEEDEDADMRDIWEGRLPEPVMDDEGKETPVPAEVSRREFLRGGAPQNPAENRS